MDIKYLAIHKDEVDTEEKHNAAREAFKKLGAKVSPAFGKWENRNDHSYEFLVVDSEDDVLWVCKDDVDYYSYTLNVVTFSELMGLAYPEKKPDNISWYDYDKQEAVAFPPVGEKVLYASDLGLNSWTPKYIVAKHHYLEYTFFIADDKIHGEILYLSDLVLIKPLDFDTKAKALAKAKKERLELLDVIVSAGAVSDGTLADILLASGYKREA